MRLLVSDKPTTDGEVTLYSGQQLVGDFKETADDKAFEIGVIPGTYDIRIQPRLPGMSERWIHDIEAGQKQVLEKEVRMDGGLARVHLVADDNPYSFENATRVMVYRDDGYVCDLEEVQSHRRTGPIGRDRP